MRARREAQTQWLNVSERSTVRAECFIKFKCPIGTDLRGYS